MPRRIVLFGATGYTGRLVAEALVRRKARPVLAGRSHQYLAALGVKLGKGLDTAVADVQHPESLLGLIQPDDVLISTVGPFARYGRPVVEAAIYRRATYLDSCGEPLFIRSVFEELDPIARQAQVALLPAFAFEFVTGSVAAGVALEAAGDSAVRVDVGYFMRGGYRGSITLGTRASAAGAALLPQFAWRDGQLQPAMAADRSRAFTVDGREVHALAVGGAEHITVPRVAPHVREVGVYMGAGGSARRARVARRVIAGAAKVPGAASATAWLGRQPIGREGPGAERRQQVGSEVVAIAYDADGRELHTARLRGGNAYSITGELMAWAAMEISRTGVAATGALGPLEAFSLDSLRGACRDAGLPVVEG